MPTKILMTFLSFSDDLHKINHIYFFKKGIDEFKIKHATVWAKISVWVPFSLKDS